MKKNVITMAALAAIAAIGLAGCGATSIDISPTLSTDTGTGTEADAAALAAIEWTVDDAGVPLLTFAAPLALTEAASRVVNEGDGAKLEPGDLVEFDYTVTSGVDASVEYSSYDEGQIPESLTLNEIELDPAFYAAFVGRSVGSDIIYATLSSDPTGETLDLLPILVAITVTKSATPLARAEGSAVAPVDGLPTVVLAADGTPSVTNPATEPPADLVSQTLIQGAGEPVVEGQKVVVHYSGLLWDGTLFDSSWSSGAPAALFLATDSLIDGWVQGLVGASVGSQVLLVIPPSLGYGDADQNAIPAGSTLVFVVDILAAI